MKTPETIPFKIATIILIFLVLTLNACNQTTVKNNNAKNNSNSKLLSNKQVDLNIDTITLGGGCYWCVEAVYEMLNGVVKVESGFSGGTVKNPSYREVCSGSTGHAEVVQITFEKTKTSVVEILKVFFTLHDPTTLNRQGADVGTQYRSVIFYRNNEQYKAAKDIVDAINSENVYGSPIVTQISPFDKFYIAEDYHQDYFDLNKEEPYCRMVIQPKIDKFEKLFKEKMKKK